MGHLYAYIYVKLARKSNFEKTACSTADCWPLLLSTADIIDCLLMALSLVLLFVCLLVSLLVCLFVCLQKLLMLISGSLR